MQPLWRSAAPNPLGVQIMAGGMALLFAYEFWWFARVLRAWIKIMF
ncbi:MAG: hypothetical protein LBJ59_06935 [Zoogloeaceae bacterium]|nr:hypothetical protein [Zoogloeaceae bacterium]